MLTRLFRVFQAPSADINLVLGNTLELFTQGRHCQLEVNLMFIVRCQLLADRWQQFALEAASEICQLQEIQKAMAFELLEPTRIRRKFATVLQTCKGCEGYPAT